MKKTKTNYEKYLNEIGTPEDDKKSSGGRIPDYANYGGWVRKNDPIGFQVEYQEWKNSKY